MVSICLRAVFLLLSPSVRGVYARVCNTGRGGRESKSISRLLARVERRLRRFELTSGREARQRDARMRFNPVGFPRQADIRPSFFFSDESDADTSAKAKWRALHALTSLARAPPQTPPSPLPSPRRYHANESDVRIQTTVKDNRLSFSVVISLRLVYNTHLPYAEEFINNARMALMLAPETVARGATVQSACSDHRP